MTVFALVGVLPLMGGGGRVAERRTDFSSWSPQKIYAKFEMVALTQSRLPQFPCNQIQVTQRQIWSSYGDIHQGQRAVTGCRRSRQCLPNAVQQQAHKNLNHSVVINQVRTKHVRMAGIAVHQDCRKMHKVVVSPLGSTTSDRCLPRRGRVATARKLVRRDRADLETRRRAFSPVFRSLLQIDWAGTFATMVAAINAANPNQNATTALTDSRGLTCFRRHNRSIPRQRLCGIEKPVTMKCGCREVDERC